MDFPAQIAEYCSAFSTPQVLAALPSHSVFLFCSRICSAFITLPVLAAIRNPLSCLSLALSVFPCFLDLFILEEILFFCMCFSLRQFKDVLFGFYRRQVFPNKSIYFSGQFLNIYVLIFFCETSIYNFFVKT